jgi:hypothetical protein
VSTNERLRRELTPEEVAEEVQGVDESLPEALTAHRRRLAPERAAGAAEHRAGDEEEPEEKPREPTPEPEDPPRRSERAEGAS